MVGIVICKHDVQGPSVLELAVGLSKEFDERTAKLMKMSEQIVGE
jgi:hypothetical protein